MHAYKQAWDGVRTGNGGGGGGAGKNDLIEHPHPLYPLSLSPLLLQVSSCRTVVLLACVLALSTHARSILSSALPSPPACEFVQDCGHVGCVPTMLRTGLGMSRT